MKSKQEIVKIIQTAMDHDDRLALATMFGLDADSWDMDNGDDDTAWMEGDLKQELAKMVDNSKYLAIANKFFGEAVTKAQQILLLIAEENPPKLKWKKKFYVG